MLPRCVVVQPAARRSVLRLSRDPGRLRAELAAGDPQRGPLIIDEIQKLPSLLDDVHDLMESRGLRFVLAASSPIKLRRGGVNLLGGRARTRALFPFVSAEVPDWDLLRAINVGGIPSIYLSPDPIEDLRAYCGSYLQLEIQAEGLVRGIEPFSRFLTAAAACRGQPIVFERLASDAAVPARTVREYFQVIEDTLLATLLQPSDPAAPAGSRCPTPSCTSSTSAAPTCSATLRTSQPAARRSARPLSTSSSASCGRGWPMPATRGRSPSGAPRTDPRSISL